jgi:tetratricopeptide (TPR) repeat protein
LPVTPCHQAPFLPGREPAAGSAQVPPEPDIEAVGARALGYRDAAVAALDDGDPDSALASARLALDLLASAGCRDGLDEAAVLVALAEIEESAGQVDDAWDTITRAVRLLDHAGPEADADTTLLWCQAQERLAGLEQLAGDFTAARARLGSVLARASAVFGAYCPAVISAAIALGVVCKSAGDFDAAQAAYERAATAYGQLGEPDPLTEAGLLHNLGGLAHARGDAAAGIALAEQGAELRTSALGADHPDVARDLNALGALYQLAARFGDAEHVCQRALTVFEHCYGPRHVEVAMTCANLAAIRSDQGRDIEAEALGRRALEIFKAVLGPQDVEVGVTLLNLAAAVAGQGRQAEALALAAEAAQILAARLPADHPHSQAAAQAVEHYRAW